MIVTIAGLLSADDLTRFRSALAAAPWGDGRMTAGPQSARAKANLQLPEDAEVTRGLGEIVLDRLGQRADFIAAALPSRVFPPQFNRYDVGMGFGDHVDNAIRLNRDSRQRYRTDLSCTLFLSEPESYDGGELVIADADRQTLVKLQAGDMVLYPATSVHRVAPVTRGCRLASFFWIQSMVRDQAQRRVLRDLDQAAADARVGLGDDHPVAVRLTGIYHNLLRMWAD